MNLVYLDKGFYKTHRRGNWSGKPSVLLLCVHSIVWAIPAICFFLCVSIYALWLVEEGMWGTLTFGTRRIDWVA